MLEFKNVTKTFGDVTAVQDLSFKIEEGQIMGLIGQNGAGKTTTFRLLLKFLRANEGQIFWNGQEISADDYNIIGYLPEERGLYPKLSIRDQLIFFAELKGKKRKDIEPKIDYWMEKFQVKGNKKDKLKKLSKGNQQKVQLIATLLHDPKLVILDEPFSGLDPVNAGILQDGILELKKQGACVIFSSHNMNNVEQICDHLIMLKSGQTVLKGKVSEIRRSFGRTRIFLESDLTPQDVSNIEGVKNAFVHEDGVLEVVLTDEKAGKAIFDLATKQGYIPMFNQQPPTLEEIFRMKAGAPNE
ncbi:ABC transporter ATP-binding protein [Holzapfeliella floricola]|uniref:ABC transporter, ATP-binding protein n=1 Tax=Holzapfeliella floricola DSM 23037 = JCM 16512 TaxID=1423744 RepID=A0A0R2DKI5_9LACO|nr:ABC transporter ATP-binding protein [Holzapfeliella floricola]KRN04601.1 ABC transporter, ATP-binding protein [Holzapfeliella floricola DSM 23037 = JCM 16512]